MKRKDTVLDMLRTGQNIKQIMNLKGYTVKDIQEHLGLSAPQAIYHWFDGKSMPTIDNLYSLSDLFCMPIDDMLIGNRKYNPFLYRSNRCGRLCMYYEKLILMQKAG